MEQSIDAGAAPAAGTALPKWIWIAGGAVALTIGGLASALALNGVRNNAQPAVAAATPAPVAKLAPAEAPPVPRAEPAPRTEPAPRAAEPQQAEAPAPVCASCGVVESVQTVRVKGEGSGVGAVAGGVVGGVVGNQFGKGNGRKAMTVLGAVGGGFAGHEVEKQVKAKTLYAVKVRMDDGTLRTVQQAQAPAVGAKVRVEGSKLRAV